MKMIPRSKLGRTLWRLYWDAVAVLVFVGLAIRAICYFLGM